jgi:hypothetical protein
MVEDYPTASTIGKLSDCDCAPNVNLVPSVVNTVVDATAGADHLAPPTAGLAGVAANQSGQRQQQEYYLEQLVG